MAGNSCIFRCTISTDNEANVTDKIEFNGGAIPDSRGHLKQSQVTMERGIAENDKPFQAINELQDTKASRITVNVVGIIDNPSVNNIAATFKIWELEDNTNTVFTKGRFGLRMDDFPAFNLSPTTLASTTPRGYLIENITLNRDIEFNRLSFTCQLRFSGDIGTAGAGYAW